MAKKSDFWHTLIQTGSNCFSALSGVGYRTLKGIDPNGEQRSLVPIMIIISAMLVSFLEFVSALFRLTTVLAVLPDFFI